MKRFPLILCIITFSLLLSACRAVNVNCADELLHSTWYVENENAMKATLNFDIDSGNVDFIITDQNKSIIEICGCFAVDKDNLYITSVTLKKTYVFGYKVYKDRLILNYNGIPLTFSAVKEKEP